MTESPLTIGFIGAGGMGAPMAGHLLAAGHPLVICDLDRDRTRRLEEVGARYAPTPAETVAASDIVMSMLPTADALRAVSLGADGLASAPSGTRTWIDFSSVDRDTMLACVEALLPAGWTVLDASVNGVEEVAAAAELAIWVSGDEALFDRHRALIDPMGRLTMHVGAQGNAKLVKTALAMYSGVSHFAITEIMSWLGLHGIGEEEFLIIMQNSPAASTMTDRLLAVVRRGEFKSRKSWMPKDVGFGLADARERQQPMPMMTLVEQLFAIAQANGLDGYESSGIADLVYRHIGHGDSGST